MSSFHLQILTPDGTFFDGEAEKVSVRACTGNLTILPRHMDFVTPLGMGEARVTVNGAVKKAACIGGMLVVKDGAVRLLATTFEWQEQIDLARALRSKERAEAQLAHRESLTADEIRLAEARLRRALVRSSLAEQ